MRIPVQISRFVLVVTSPENLCLAQEWRVDVGPLYQRGRSVTIHQSGYRASLPQVTDGAPVRIG
ncbi:hypothetical protein CBM2634_A230154 [Cupriavidus taiwanensis]|uniref:Uncharacterized protein n=1 Tax=Cupriavidus taiwanensis TaxID=164546 RepID=A0A375IYP7_9BURK|nr:hypothetical protein CBM2634_A230154 [Cupriavidus taiwanensis]